jgi:hypothetical protein
MSDQSFETTYGQMSDGELAKVLRDRRDLVPEARTALDLEVRKRDLDPSQLRKFRPHSIDKPWSRTRLGRFSKKIGIEEMRTKRIRGMWLVTLLVLSTLFAGILGHFGILEFFWPIITTIAIPAFTVWGHWKLKRQAWFWITIALVIAAHAAFFFFAGWPWGRRWVPAMTIAGLWNVDLIVVFTIIYFVEKLIGEKSDGSARLGG